MRGKRLQAGSYFRQHDLGHPAVDARPLIELLDLSGKRARLFVDLLIPFGNPFLLLSQLFPQPPQQESMMLGHVSLERLLQLRHLAAQLCRREAGKLQGIVFAIDQPCERGPARHAQNVGRY